MEKPKTAKKQYMFTVDVMLESYSNGIALETLLHLLNSDQIKDYRITQGIELGRMIDIALSDAQASKPAAVAGRKHPADKGDRTAVLKSQPKTDDNGLHEQVTYYKENNTLVRLTVLKGKGVKLSIPCRILNFDGSSEMLTVYHVDEKKVYQFRLAEVDDLTKT